MPKNVLIVDDEEDLRELFSQVVSFSGFKTKTASGGKEALKLAKENQFDAVLSDIRMPKGDGAELLKELKKIYPNLPIYIMSGYNDYTTDELLKLGAEKVYSKPFNYEDFIFDLNKKLNIETSKS
jgi:DNA-binding NtrC family response regulator